MRLVLFDNYRLGALRGADVVDLSDLIAGSPAGAVGEVVDRVIADWAELRPRLQDAVDARDPVGRADTMQLKAPVPRPGKVLCMATSYRENTEHPALPIAGFIASPQAILDPGGTVQLPPVELSICHHEAELVVVIGAQARNVDRTEALECVFGYTCGVDISARQTLRASPFLAKSWDTFKPLGSCIATADEVPDPQNLRIQLRVNDEDRQDFNTSDMGYSVAEMIEWWSSIVTLMPGDLIYTGTNHQGLGGLQDKDSVQMTIENVGSLHFDVSDPLRRTWPSGVDASVGKAVRQRLVDAAQHVRSA